MFYFDLRIHLMENDLDHHYEALFTKVLILGSALIGLISMGALVFVVWTLVRLIFLPSNHNVGQWNTLSEESKF